LVTELVGELYFPDLNACNLIALNRCSSEMDSLNFSELEAGLLNRLFNNIFRGNELMSFFMFENVSHVGVVCDYYTCIDNGYQS